MLGGLESTWLLRRRITENPAEDALHFQKKKSKGSLKDQTLVASHVQRGDYGSGKVHLDNLPLGHYRAEQPPPMLGVSESTCWVHYMGMTGNSATGCPLGS